MRCHQARDTNITRVEPGAAGRWAPSRRRRPSALPERRARSAPRRALVLRGFGSSAFGSSGMCDRTASDSALHAASSKCGQVISTPSASWMYSISSLSAGQCAITAVIVRPLSRLTVRPRESTHVELVGLAAVGLGSRVYDFHHVMRAAEGSVEVGPRAGIPEMEGIAELCAETCAGDAPRLGAEAVRVAEGSAHHAHFVSSSEVLGVHGATVEDPNVAGLRNARTACNLRHGRGLGAQVEAEPEAQARRGRESRELQVQARVHRAAADFRARVTRPLADVAYRVAAACASPRSKSKPRFAPSATAEPEFGRTLSGAWTALFSLYFSDGVNGGLTLDVHAGASGRGEGVPALRVPVAAQEVWGIEHGPASLWELQEQNTLRAALCSSRTDRAVYGGRVAAERVIVAAAPRPIGCSSSH